ncbi:hypothetical protein PVAP13_2NG573920 [Panicum virgatum]|uniref:Uncharacterized protein n=1 Tax=Panicum virgatum TaxID=38727 RepID=A0A8T0VTK2_PANVG|nr:hypothetical protein PVAP13_2NG573920 [Panicum virgatum]
MENWRSIPVASDRGAPRAFLSSAGDSDRGCPHARKAPSAPIHSLISSRIPSWDSGRRRRAAEGHEHWRWRLHTGTEQEATEPAAELTLAERCALDGQDPIACLWSADCRPRKVRWPARIPRPAAPPRHPTVRPGPPIAIGDAAAESLLRGGRNHGRRHHGSVSVVQLFAENVLGEWRLRADHAGAAVAIGTSRAGRNERDGHRRPLGSTAYPRRGRGAASGTAMGEGGRHMPVSPPFSALHARRQPEYWPAMVSCQV